KRRKVSLQDVCLITNIFRLAGSRLFVKQQNWRCNCRSRNGPSCVVVLAVDRPATSLGVQSSCDNGATNRLSNLDWSHLSSRRAARLKRLQLIPYGQPP